MPFQENFPEFCARHGGDQVTHDHRTWLLPDGAVAIVLGEGMFDLREPPTALVRLLEKKRQFEAAWLARAEADFKEVKDALLGRGALISNNQWPAHYGPLVADGKSRLLRLRDIATEHRAQIEELDEQLGRQPEVIAQRERARIIKESEAKQQTERAEFLAEVEAITL